MLVAIDQTLACLNRFNTVCECVRERVWAGVCNQNCTIRIHKHKHTRIKMCQQKGRTRCCCVYLFFCLSSFLEVGSLFKYLGREGRYTAAVFFLFVTHEQQQQQQLLAFANKKCAHTARDFLCPPPSTSSSSSSISCDLLRD